MKKILVSLVLIFLTGCAIGNTEKQANNNDLELENKNITDNDPLNLLNNKPPIKVEGGTDKDPLALFVQTETEESNYTDFIYYNLDKLTPIYNEYDILSGYLLKATTKECGSDCTADLLFINFKNNNLNIEKVENLEGQSLGFDVFEENKYTYVSSFIWGEDEGHFGCHKFTIDKVKFINNKLEFLEKAVTKKQYAFDSGDAQGQCDLFSGIEDLLKNEQLFQ